MLFLFFNQVKNPSSVTNAVEYELDDIVCKPCLEWAERAFYCGRGILNKGVPLFVFFFLSLVVDSSLRNVSSSPIRAASISFFFVWV